MEDKQIENHNKDDYTLVVDEKLADEDNMVTHFGLFWSVADVLWSGKKEGYGLLGREKAEQGRRGRPTREESIDRKNNVKSYSSFIGVYCLYRDGRLVYVGEAGLGNSSNLLQRLKAHLSDHLADSWDEFSWFGRPKTDQSARSSTIKAFAQLEAIFIAVTNPGSNKQSGTFGGATQVFQAPHEKAEGDVHTKLDRILKKIAELENLKSVKGIS